MAQPLPFLIHEPEQSRAELYLGPALVAGVQGLRPMVRLPDGREVVAEMALAFPYNFARGDVLLVIARGTSTYAIGVLSSEGEVSLRFQGDVSLHAVGGQLSLRGDEGLLLRSPEVQIKTRKMKVFADALVQKVSDMVQTVRSTWHVQAGEKHEHVQGTSSLQAERASVLTKGVVTINGKEVHLG